MLLRPGFFALWLLAALLLLSTGCGGPQPAPSGEPAPAAAPLQTAGDSDGSAEETPGPAARIDARPQIEALARQIQPATPGGPDSLPRALVFDATRFDFGKVKSTDGILSATFTARNTTDRDITIVRTEKDCGCLLARPMPPVIRAGETLVVMLQANPSGRSGRQQHLFTIQTDEPVPHYFLALVADVELVRGADQPNVYIPSLVRGTTEHVQVIIDSASDVLSRAGIELPEPNLLLTRSEVDGATLDLWITTAPAAIRAKVHSRILIRHPDSRDVVAEVPIVVVVDENVHFNTPSLFYGTMAPGTPAVKEVQLLSYFGEVPRVDRAMLVGCSEEQGQVEVLADRSPTTLRVTVYPEKLVGPVYRDVLRVELGSAEQPEATLPVIGIIRGENPTLDFSATPTPR